MKQVVIRSILDMTDWDYVEIVEVYVDGKMIGEGEYGGAPEDNMRSRDYDWVEPLLKKLAAELGAEVTITKVDIEEENQS